MWKRDFLCSERETERGKYKKYQSSDMIPALKKKNSGGFRCSVGYTVIVTLYTTEQGGIERYWRFFFSERERETIAAAAVSKSAAEREQLHSKNKREKNPPYFFLCKFSAGWSKTIHVQQTSVQLNYFLAIFIFFTYSFLATKSVESGHWQRCKFQFKKKILVGT